MKLLYLFTDSSSGDLAVALKKKKIINCNFSIVMSRMLNTISKIEKIIVIVFHFNKEG